jgi:transposase
MANERAWRYPEDFRRLAVERFKKCENIEWLAKELGVPRQTLYRWHEESQRAEAGEEQPTEKSRESRLRREISDLKRLFAEKTLEVNFFRGALQKVEARQHESSGSGVRHLRPHPGRNVAARRFGYRTDVPTCGVE